MKLYDVTITAVGSIKTWAETEEEALRKVNEKLQTPDGRSDIQWADISTTDVQKEE